MDDLDYNQDNILVGIQNNNSNNKLIFAACDHSPTNRTLNVKTDYDDDCPLVPILVAEETLPMSLPPQFALQAVLETLGSMPAAHEESRDDALMESVVDNTKNAVSQLRVALESLQGNERRFLLPLVDKYSMDSFLNQGPQALQGRDLQCLEALQEAAGPRWNLAVLRVKRIVSTEDSDDEFEGSQSSRLMGQGPDDDDDDDEGYADSRLYIDKLVCWTGKRPVDVRWFNLGLHSVQDGGIVLETEEQVEFGDMWTQVEAANDGDNVYETFILAFYDKAIRKNKFSWLKY